MLQTLLQTRKDSCLKNEPFEWCRGICMTAREGERCMNFPSPGSRYCHWHQHQEGTAINLLSKYRWDEHFFCICCHGNKNNGGCLSTCEVNNVINIEADRQSIESAGL